jgi:hypothetical protein
MSMNLKTAIPNLAYLVLVGAMVIPALVFETLLGSRPYDHESDVGVAT